MQGTDPANANVAEGGLEAEARQALRNIGQLMEFGGRKGIERKAASMFGNVRSQPPLHLTPRNLAPSLLVMLEAIAVR